MKKLIVPISLVSVMLSLSVVAPVHAQEKMASKAAERIEKAASKAAEVKEKIASKTAELQAGRLEKIQDRGSTAIDARVAKLQAVLATISSATYLTADQKTQLTKDIQTQIDGLNATKTALAADATAEAARATYQKIFTDFRIYALFLPKTHTTLLVDHTYRHLDTLMKFGDKLNTRITKAKTDGMDTAQIESIYTDYTAHVSSAKTKVDAVSKLLATLTPTASASAKTTVTSIRTQLKAVQDDITVAHKDAADILAGLKTLHIGGAKDATKSASASAKVASASAKTASASAKTASSSASTASSSAKVATTSANH